jgi:hypothetical protein
MQEGGVCSIPTTEGQVYSTLQFKAMHEISTIISLGLTFSMLTGVEKKRIGDKVQAPSLGYQIQAFSGV